MFEASGCSVSTLQCQDQPESGLLSSMTVDQASVNQAIFLPVSNISVAVFPTYVYIYTLSINLILIMPVRLTRLKVITVHLLLL